MEELCKILIWLFRYVTPDAIFSGEINYEDISLGSLEALYFAYDYRSDESENRRKLLYLKDQTDFMLRESDWQSDQGGFNVFDLMRCFNRHVLTCMHEDVVCRFEALQMWREMTGKVDASMFVAAKYAEIDRDNGKTRNKFTWSNVIGHNNAELNTILSNGISDN